MAIIEVKGLKKNYGDVQAVKGISFEVQEGEVFAILGPNGAGKTTTLEILEGLKAADSGEVKIAGFDIKNNLREAKLTVGVQLQSESFFDGLELVELLELLASFYGTKVNAFELLKSVDLLDKAYVRYAEMSGGQQRRFSIAAALVNMPKVLFLDEPTTGLDPQARRYIWELVKKIKASGTTIILTSHYMEEAQVLSDRVAVMDHGKIIKIGTPEELIKTLPVKSVITFRAEADLNPSDLKYLYGVEAATKADGAYQLETADPTGTLYRLLQDAYDKKFTLDDLNMRRPTLEDVFLYYTGHSLRD